ncbi:phosphonate ABC transporter ATP-binding protein [Carnobacteriaceae bacterium zg-84]|uniref:phosphonate ABC transporter ATP-binding protein n=1 Tax=Granulicatella sp. zg-84 TaxID=2678503 RepID=UPI0013BF0425|nr:phosphonate ABC transporter ATP-binding protein [Granulicatella sp. zg-84]NEW66598.1 phosphonate ABC transporter ATP-binding protein [Granulicatella sp. zg-84]QMI86249.1 phosphonate ABC transporter ATP-binding protein [Carnobacteriaceae bacterium zg-84]
MIEFKKVSKTYPNGTKGLIDVDVTIEQGEFIAIIGLSGSGKSTFIRCVNKMHDITSGELFVNEQNVQKITGRDVRKFRRNIGMVFQSFNLVTRTTVIKNVLTAFVPELSGFRKFFGIFPRECKIKSLEALDKVDMFEKAYVRVDQLSGGQQQRVALARALAQNPEIILADEPVAALDPVTSNQVMDDFRRINKENNITILLNIHDVDLALKYCDRVIGINKGHIVYDGSAKDVTKDILEKIYQKDLFSNGE